ncbi:MAG: serine/threonine-protein kinase, partial [Anaerolineales bacterium]
MLMQKIGRYEIIRELGKGGMATVYLASDPAFGRRVAVKILPAQFSDDKEFRARFQREAKVIAALEHPYIVPVYDYGEQDNRPYIVMRNMPGGTLADRTAGKPLKLDEAIPIVQRLAEALDEAHSQEIVHRDLKPTNVLFDARGQPFLSDFGIAKLLEATTTNLTLTGVLGTPAYMSPEQALGEELDGRSDVYALGVILYEMLAGRKLYDAKTPAAVMMQHVTASIPPLDVVRLGLPPKVNAILSRALAKEKAERYQTAWELAEAFNTLDTGPAWPKAAAQRSRTRPIPRTRRLPVRPTTQATVPLQPNARPTDGTGQEMAFPIRKLLGGALAGGLVVTLFGVLLIWGLDMGWFSGGGASPTRTPGAGASP